MGTDIAKLQVCDTPVPDSGEDFDFLYEESATAKWPLGTRVALTNGAVFRYAYAAEGLTINKLCSSATVAADHDADLAGVGAATAAIGAKTIAITNGASTTITENMFQGGQLYVNDVTGEGQNFFIKSHTSAAVNSTCTFQVTPPVHVAITSQSQIGLVPHPFYKVQMYDPTAESWPIGMTNKAVTSGYYFWLQTWGPTTAIADASAPAQGAPLSPSSATQGTLGEYAVTTISAGVYPCVGINGPLDGVSTETMAIWLTLCP